MRPTGPLGPTVLLGGSGGPSASGDRCCMASFSRRDDGFLDIRGGSGGPAASEVAKDCVASDTGDLEVSFPPRSVLRLFCPEFWSLVLESKAGFFGTGGAGLRETVDDVETADPWLDVRGLREVAEDWALA